MCANFLTVARKSLVGPEYVVNCAIEASKDDWENSRVVQCTWLTLVLKEVEKCAEICSKRNGA